MYKRQVVYGTQDPHVKRNRIPRNAPSFEPLFVVGDQFGGATGERQVLDVYKRQAFVNFYENRNERAY